MIRVICYSTDRKLQAILGPALGPQYDLRVEADKETVTHYVRNHKADVMILDFDSEYGSLEDGFQVFEANRDFGIPVVVMTDDIRRSATLSLVQRGAYDYFRKPPSIAELRVVLSRAYQRVELERELAKAKRQLREAFSCDGFIGSSAGAQAVGALVRRVASLDAPVLVRGETGTGKELVARAIHNLGKRAKHPFVAVPCGAIPETLIEAELFGHEKGAYTGSAGPREGYLEQAGEGTLLLDEIGELSLQTQVKLLRVLQQREFSRLGSCRLIPLRARVVAATHRPLEQMVETGTFRLDLLFRLNVMTIEVPPLRERADDIPALARYFVEQAAAAFGMPVCEISPPAMDLLTRYRWPGNVRELENAVQSALVNSDGRPITPDALPKAVREAEQPLVEEGDGALGFEERLREYKVELALKALAQSNGNKTEAARSLQISRAYFHRLLRSPSIRGQGVRNGTEG